MRVLQYLSKFRHCVLCYWVNFHCCHVTSLATSILVYLHRVRNQNTGQWLWLSRQSVRFRYQRSVV